MSSKIRKRRTAVSTPVSVGGASKRTKRVSVPITKNKDEDDENFILEIPIETPPATPVTECAPVAKNEKQSEKPQILEQIIIQAPSPQEEPELLSSVFLLEPIVLLGVDVATQTANIEMIKKGSQTTKINLRDQRTQTQPNTGEMSTQSQISVSEIGTQTQVFHEDKGVQTDIEIRTEPEQVDVPIEEPVIAPEPIVDGPSGEPPRSPDWMVHERYQFFPFEHRNITGTLLTDIYVLHTYYEAIEVVERVEWTTELTRKLKTEYIPITNPYWMECVDFAMRNRPANPRFIKSRYDDATIWLQYANGFIYATRHGVRVIIKYPDGGTGRIRQYPPLTEIFDPNDPPVIIQRRNPTRMQHDDWEGVPISHLNFDCPMYHRAFKGLLFPAERGYSRVVRCIHDDNLRLFILVEPNGQIDIKRQGRRFRLRWATQ